MQSLSTAAQRVLSRISPPVAATLLGLLGVCLWVYWPTLAAMAHKWVSDPQYSHGYLVPAFSLFLLWQRRACRADVAWRPDWRGLPLLAVGVLLRFAGAYLYFDWLDAVSLLPCLAGIAVLLGGWPALRWSWPAIAFLVFMIPLPYRIETALGHPLQRIATLGSTYTFQTLGLTAFAEGNTIQMASGKIGVVAACSGLSMLLIFFALSTAVLIVVQPPLLDRLLIVASSLPIAIIVNIIRIAATGVAQEYFGPRVAHTIFHDWAGWLMMPLALGLLALELWLLGRILCPIEVTRPLAMTLAQTHPTAETRPAKRNAAKANSGRRGAASLRGR